LGPGPKNGYRVEDPSTGSFFIGEDNDPDGLTVEGGHWNRIKDAYLKSFRSEYVQRLKALSAPGQLLHPLQFQKVVDQLAAEFDPTDITDSPIISPALPRCWSPDPNAVCMPACKPGTYCDGGNPGKCLPVCTPACGDNTYCDPTGKCADCDP